MYLYDDIDQRLVEECVHQFRDQTQRFLSGKLSEDDFRPLRLQNGLYVQRYAPMLRVAFRTDCSIRSSCACLHSSPSVSIAAMGISRRDRTFSSTGPGSRTRPIF